jgi:hypothetical protein
MFSCLLTPRATVTPPWQDVRSRCGGCAPRARSGPPAPIRPRLPGPGSAAAAPTPTPLEAPSPAADDRIDAGTLRIGGRCPVFLPVQRRWSYGPEVRVRPDPVASLPARLPSLESFFFPLSAGGAGSLLVTIASSRSGATSLDFRT